MKRYKDTKALLGVIAGVVVGAGTLGASLLTGDAKAGATPPGSATLVISGNGRSVERAADTPLIDASGGNKNCSDTTATSAYLNQGPGPGANYGSDGAGTTLNLTCNYYNNTNANRWYAEARISGGRLAYVYVQYLAYGSSHQCYIVNDAVENIGYGNYCDLINYP